MARACHAPWPLCKQANASQQGEFQFARLCPPSDAAKAHAGRCDHKQTWPLTLCRYQLTYSVTDSSGTAAVPLVLNVNTYESGQILACLLLMSQAPNAAAATAWAAAIPQTNYSSNAALRSALAGSLSAWLTNVGARTTVAEAATTVFDGVDAFPYSAVQQSDVALLSAVLVQNLTSYVQSNTSASSGTVTSGNFAVLVAVRVIVNSTAYATTVNSSSLRRRELLVEAEADTAFTLAAPHTRAWISAAAAAGRPQRRHLQADTSTTVSALELKLHLLTSAFQGVSSCNATAITSLYFEGVAPLFLAASCSAANHSAQSSSNAVALNSYLLQAASVASNNLLPYQVLQLSGMAVAATLTPAVDSLLAELAAVMEATRQLIQQSANRAAIVTALAVGVASQAQEAAAKRSHTLQDLAALSAASSASDDASIRNVQAAFDLVSSSATNYSFSSVSVSRHLICSGYSSCGRH